MKIGAFGFYLGAVHLDGRDTASDWESPTYILMKTPKEYTREELLGIFQRAGESLVAEKKDSTADKVREAIHASRTLFKKAVSQGVTITAIRKHLEAMGLKCTSDCLRVALIQEGLWTARQGKASTAGDSASA